MHLFKFVPGKNVYSVPGSFGGPTRKVPRKTVTGYDFRATLKHRWNPGSKNHDLQFFYKQVSRYNPVKGLFDSWPTPDLH